MGKHHIGDPTFRPVRPMFSYNFDGDNIGQCPFKDQYIPSQKGYHGKFVSKDPANFLFICWSQGTLFLGIAASFICEGTIDETAPASWTAGGQWFQRRICHTWNLSRFYNLFFLWFLLCFTHRVVLSKLIHLRARYGASHKWSGRWNPSQDTVLCKVCCLTWTGYGAPRFVAEIVPVTKDFLHHSFYHCILARWRNVDVS